MRSALRMRSNFQAAGWRPAGRWVGRVGMSKGRLAILPGLTHYTIFSSPALASTVESFLDGTEGGVR